MHYYPAFLDLRGKKVLVVGGGRVAAQKAKAFARSGALVTVVAPRFNSRFPSSVVIRKRQFQSKDLAHAFLACVATDNEPLNAHIARLCRRNKILVNVVDRPELCDFIVPAVVSRPPLTLALSTGGASPGLAKFLRQKAQAWLGPEYSVLGRWLGQKRHALKQLHMSERRRLLKQLFQEKTVADLKNRPKQTLRRLNRRLKAVLGDSSGTRLF